MKKEKTIMTPTIYQCKTTSHITFLVYIVTTVIELHLLALQLMCKAQRITDCKAVNDII